MNERINLDLIWSETIQFEKAILILRKQGSIELFSRDKEIVTLFLPLESGKW